MLEQLRSFEAPLYNASKHCLSRHIEYHLHSAVSVAYAPISTSPDGNCLWHMVSIGLCGSEKLTAPLRLLTILTLIENEVYFQDLIDNDNSPERTYHSVVKTAATWGAWGDEYHLHALAIALNACICVYTTFRLPNGYIPLVECNGGMLAELFLQGADYTRQHIRYQRPGNLVQGQRQSVMYGFFLGGHYTAMLKRSTSELSFFPNTNLFSHGKVKLLSQFFNM